AAGPADAGHLGVAGEEAMGEGAAGSPRSGMDGQAGRLEEDDQLVVLIEEIEVAGLGEHPLLCGRRRAAVDGVAEAEGQRRADGAAVDPHEPVADPALHLVAGEVETGGDVSVQPLAGARRRDRPRRLEGGRRRRGVGRRPGSAAAAARWPRRLSIAISTMPIEMALSATLKAGQWWPPQ